MILILKHAQPFAMNPLKIHVIHENSIFALQHMKIFKEFFFFFLCLLFLWCFWINITSRIRFIFCCCCFYWDFRVRDSCNLQLFCCSLLMILLQLIHRHDRWSDFHSSWLVHVYELNYFLLFKFFFHDPIWISILVH